MCGLVAIHDHRGEVDPSLPRLAAETMRHRGPDHRGLWTAPNGRTVLAHARLGLVGLDSGNQPLSNEDGSIRVVMTGEFYDYRTIAAELAKECGHRLATDSDAEILAHLYEDDDIACLTRLRGEFAFVLWDDRRGRLFAARDRFGVKPLYFSLAGGRVTLATEVKGMFAAGIAPRWEAESLYRALFFCLDGERSLYGDIHQIPPGHYLLAEGGRVEIRRYWDIDYPRDGERPAGQGDAKSVARFGEILDETVALRLHGEVPVGCFLSGGLDSSSVLGLATRAASDSLDAFTLVYDEEGYDESGIARETAEFCAARHTLVAVDGADFADHLADAIWHAETLAFNLHGVARYLLCRRIHQAGFRAMLSGEGADELLAGYGFVRHDGVGSAPGLVSPLAGVSARLGFVPHWLDRIATQRALLHLFLIPDFAAAHDGLDVYGEAVSRPESADQLDGRSRLDRSLYLWNRTILPNYILAAERLEMAHAVEVRLPFLDHHLFEFVRGLPHDLLFRAGREKHLLRETTRGVITPAVYNRAKQPFSAPPHAMQEGAAVHELVQDLLRSEAMRSQPFFDRFKVIAFLEDSVRFDESLRAAADAALLAMVSVVVLQQRFNLS